MDITKERLKVKCNGCEKPITITFNTTQCPFCGLKFESEEIHNIFYNYETKLANSKAHKFGENLEKTGEGISSFGNWLQSVGCLIFFIPALIFLFLILKAILGS